MNDTLDTRLKKKTDGSIPMRVLWVGKTEDLSIAPVSGILGSDFTIEYCGTTSQAIEIMAKESFDAAVIDESVDVPTTIRLFSGLKNPHPLIIIISNNHRLASVDDEAVVERLKQSENRLRTIIDGSQDIIFQTDHQGRLTFVSRAISEIAGYDADEITGMHISEFIAPEYKEVIHERFKERLAGRQLSTYALDIIARNGRRITIEITTAPVQGDEGRTIGTQGIARNITRRRLVENEILQAYKELETRVEERTQQLALSKARLNEEIDRRKKLEMELTRKCQDLEELAGRLREAVKMNHVKVE